MSPIPSEQFRKFAVSNTICHVQNNQTVCRLLNYSDKCLIIKADQKIAQIAPFDNSYHCLAVSEHENSNLMHENEQQEFQIDDATLHRFAAEYAFNINDQLSPELRLKLLRVL